MATDFVTDYTFRYNSKKYQFSAYIFEYNDRSNEHIVLQNNNIGAFEWTNELNGLVLTGSLVYTDAYGNVDKFFGRHIGLVNIDFGQLVQKSDGGVITEVIDEIQHFNHTFFVNSLDILERDKTKIKYKLNLVSINWIKVISTLRFSNYNREPESITEIFKQLLSMVGLDTDPDTWCKLKSKVKINWITNGNQNLFTALKYLFSKMYYYEKKEESLKFIVYDDQKYRYQLFDITDKPSYTGVYYDVIEMNKSNIEEMLHDNPTNFRGYQKRGFDQIYPSVYEHDFYVYNYTDNILSNNCLSSKPIVNYYNNHFDDLSVENKNQGLLENDDDLIFRRAGAFWNNDYNIYFDQTMNLMNADRFVLDASGDIARKAGALQSIGIDRDVKKCCEEQNSQLYQEMMQRYRDFEGHWIVAKVRHKIFPGVGSADSARKPYFRDDIGLVRNIMQIKCPPNGL